MEILAVALAAFALLLAFIALSTAKSARVSADDAATDARRAGRNAEEELERALEVHKKLLARVAAGEAVSQDMILEGKLWSDVTADAGKEMVAAGDDLYLLDVRTPQETSLGIIPGATLIPIDELEERMREIPRGRKMLVYCAGGGRSAAACEFLSHEGYEGLHNLEGGFGSWGGPTERPA